MNETTPADGSIYASNAAAIGAALWDSGDMAGAAAHFTQALQQNSQDFEALHGLGRLRLAQNELAGAMLLLERALVAVEQVAAPRRAELAQRVRRDLAWTTYRLDRFELAGEQLAALPTQAGLAAQLRAFGATPPYRLAAEVEEIALPFLGTEPLPIVTVGLGGREYAFVIDSGSNQVVIDTGLLREHELPHLGLQEAAPLASGQRAPIGYTRLPMLQLGEATIHDVPAEVMDIRRVAPQLSGLIGSSFLRHFHVLCDWEGEVLRLRSHRWGAFEGFATMVSSPFLLMDSHLMLAPARLNEHATLAFVASGVAGTAFTVPSTTAQQAKLTHAHPMEAVSAAGAEALETVQAARLCLGGWCRTAQEGLLGFFPEELRWRYGFEVGMLVAHSFLKQRRWGIDFEKMQFYFD